MKTNLMLSVFAKHCLYDFFFMCGNIFCIEPKQFFQGRRCPQCFVLPSYDEVGSALADASHGCYQMVGCRMYYGDIDVINKDTNEVIRLSRHKAVQELTRPTPSTVFPGIKTGYRFPDWEEYIQKYIAFYKEKGMHPSHKIVYQGLRLGQWSFTMRQLRKQGMLTMKRIQELSAAGFDWGDVEYPDNNR